MSPSGANAKREDARAATAIWGSADYSNDAPTAQVDPKRSLQERRVQLAESDYDGKRDLTPAYRGAYGVG